MAHIVASIDCDHKIGMPWVQSVHFPILVQKRILAVTAFPLAGGSLSVMDSIPEHNSPSHQEFDEERLSYVLAENVKRLRLEAKINKHTFALMLGIGRPFLNKIENGLADPRLSVIVKIADALETTPEELLTVQKPADKKRRPPARLRDESGHARLR